MHRFIVGEYLEILPPPPPRMDIYILVVLLVKAVPLFKCVCLSRWWDCFRVNVQHVYIFYSISQSKIFMSRFVISFILCLFNRREQFLQWIENLPDSQTPSWLGLPNNAEKVLLTNKGAHIRNNSYGYVIIHNLTCFCKMQQLLIFYHTCIQDPLWLLSYWRCRALMMMSSPLLSPLWSQQHQRKLAS